MNSHHIRLNMKITHPWNLHIHVLIFPAPICYHSNHSMNRVFSDVLILLDVLGYFRIIYFCLLNFSGSLVHKGTDVIVYIYPSLQIFAICEVFGDYKDRYSILLISDQWLCNSIHYNTWCTECKCPKVRYKYTPTHSHLSWDIKAYISYIILITEGPPAFRHKFIVYTFDL